MCGRYGLYDIKESELLQENKGYTFKPNYNVAPTQTMPVMIANNNVPLVKVMKWGITRSIGPDTEKNIFNTRSEKALERFWGKTVRNNRCLIPANGFYEWSTSADGKIPYWIQSYDHPLIYFAGIYDVDSDGIQHYSIMTTTPNEEMEKLHNRMPVILDTKAQEAWLYVEEQDVDMLEVLLKPLPNDSLEIYEVSKDVNYVRNNSGELITPLNSA